MENLAEEIQEYIPLPTLRLFHESGAQIRCIVGPVGSGKTSAASWDVCYYLPQFLFERYGMTKTRWAVVRNTYPELRDTTMRTLFEWFSWGHHKKQENIYTLDYPDYSVEILFRSCDSPKDIKKFKSLEITGYWIDESIEVGDEIKRMLKTRIGRFPRKCPVRFGIETTNPPDIEHPTYFNFDWQTHCPGPMPAEEPLRNHHGFWQPPMENVKNLRDGYYDDLRLDYRDNKDWVAVYIEGQPGIMAVGKVVFNNFKRDYHVAKKPLVWSGGKLYRGWDHSGNVPGCVVLQIPSPRQIQVLTEFHSDKMGIVDFAQTVQTQCNLKFPDARYEDWGDPAGNARFSKREGGFTSNTELIREATKINIRASEQNWEARKESVENQLRMIDGFTIDSSCIRLINGFIGGYHYRELAARSGVYTDKPEKNKFSHIHDSLQYVMMQIIGNTMEKTDDQIIKERILQQQHEEYDPLRFGLGGDDE